MDDKLKAGDRVRWIHNEPGANPNEVHGKLVGIFPDGEAVVRWDDGSEEGCELADLAKDSQ